MVHDNDDSRGGGGGWVVRSFLAVPTPVVSEHLDVAGFEELHNLGAHCNPHPKDPIVFRYREAEKRPEDRWIRYRHGERPEGPFRLGPWLAIAARYHGIGGNRVRLNCDHFVTAFTYDLDIV